MVNESKRKALEQQEHSQGSDAHTGDDIYLLWHVKEKGNEKQVVTKQGTFTSRTRVPPCAEQALSTCKHPLCAGMLQQPQLSHRPAPRV